MKYLALLFVTVIAALPAVGEEKSNAWYPRTEKVGADEMFVVALGTGMPTPITRGQKSAAWYVELGNGDIFLFDAGSGSAENLFALRPDMHRIDKIFASHLHTDHVGDTAAIWVGGWLSGRYTPLHVYGPSGSKPELGTSAFVDGLKMAYAWDITGRSGILPDAGGQIIAHELDYKKDNGVVYEQNGVKITSFPAVHVLDGGFGKIMAEVKPRLAVGYHTLRQPELDLMMIEEVRKVYDGPLVIADDLMAWTITKEAIVQREVVSAERVQAPPTTKS